jgi:hypothetical protein
MHLVPVGRLGNLHIMYRPMPLQATPGVSDDEEEEEDTTKEKFCFCFPMPRSHH